MSKIPKDPNMLYSYINMMLRDEYGSLEDLCAALDVSQEDITRTLAQLGCNYDETINQFR